MVSRIISKRVCCLTWLLAFGLGLTIFGGCAGTPGETAQEVNRRHIRVLDTAHKELQDDIDAWMMLDQPSRLSDRIVR